jgi:hypothetical protein
MRQSADAMNLIRKHYPCLFVLALYSICIIAANPAGEFPLNDDWSYTRSAFALSSGHGLKVDEWAAPSLVGQAFYGGLLAKLFSPSFLVLRISTLLLSCGTVTLLWGIFRRIPLRNDLACILLFAWVFNPLQFNLSFTFMTEIPFLFFIVLALYLYVRYRGACSPGMLLASAAALGYAFLIRQTALFFLLALLCAVLIDLQSGFAKRLRHSIGAAAVFGVFVASYYLWIAVRGGSTAAMHRKFELLQHLSAKQIAGNGYGMLFYLVFMSVPVWLALVPDICRMMRRAGGKIRIAFLAAWPLFIAAGLCWFWSNFSSVQQLPSTAYHARMPYLLNVLYDTGLGPVTLDPAYYGPSPNPTYPRAWIAVTAIVSIGALLCGALFVIRLLQRRSLPLFQKQKPLYVFAGLALLGIIPFEIIFGHLWEGGLFDRHILIAALPFSLLLGLFAGEDNRNDASLSRMSSRLPAGIAIAALGIFCILATHDYMAWNRIRWDIGRRLIAQGIDPLSIAGGFEFNAWYNYDTFLARGDITNGYKWWYDRRDYIIGTSPQQGYDVLEKKEYFSWLHHRLIPLYLIRDARASGARKIPQK